MEFVSQAEALTAFLLLPFLSVGIFFIISFIEILIKYDEILLVTKNHQYSKIDFIIPLIAGVFVFILFFSVYFLLDDYLNSLPPTTPNQNDPNYKPKKSVTWFTLIDDHVKPLLDQWISK